MRFISRPVVIISEPGADANKKTTLIIRLSISNLPLGPGLAPPLLGLLQLRDNIRMPGILTTRILDLSEFPIPIPNFSAPLELVTLSEE